jgi:hypothetical protein
MSISWYIYPDLENEEEIEDIVIFQVKQNKEI